MSNKFIAFIELLRNYAKVFRESWKNKPQESSAKLSPSELEFLPAVVEIQETPANPFARVLLWLLCGFLLLALLWTIWGKIDIIATAQGKIIPNGKIKLIQTISTAKVKQILVTDGQYVHAGEVLVTLDSTLSQADLNKTQNEYIKARLDVIRNQALLDKISSNDLKIDWNITESYPGKSAMINIAQEQFNDQWLEFQSKIAENYAQQQQVKATIKTNQTLIKKYQETLPMLREKEADYLTLYNEHYATQHTYLDASKQRVETEQDLASTKAKFGELSAQLSSSEVSGRLLIAEFKRTTSEQLAEANQRLSAAAAELDKAQEVNDYSEITSPSDGYVQQLSTNTIGGVVSPNQVIMAIVPDNAGILIEAQLENQDIGFVHESQEVEIKIAAFPFTRYGVLKGIVTSVSSDAVNDDKGQLRYNVYINLDQNYIMINEKKTPLNIGMQVTAEIKTGKRPIIDYFSSPLIQATTTSFKER